MKGIIALDLGLIISFIIVLFAVPAMRERNNRAAWKGKMKRLALRHIVRGNSEYGQARYCVIGGVK